MTRRIRNLWLRLSGTLGFVPGLVVVAFGAVGIVLVEIDANIDLEGQELVFSGDADAARTVLSVIAGSLITVAGLTFSITMVVLQLTSSQFSPRILRTFVGDRVTQLTIGTFVGTFVYALLVLREVGSFGPSGGVPRLSVTLAVVLGIAAVLLLVVFLHHVSQLIQVSHLTANLAQAGLAELDRLYPERVGEAAASDDPADRRERWSAEARPGSVLPGRPGFVSLVGLDDQAEALLDAGVERVAVRVRPGDFVSLEMPIAEVWPADATSAAQAPLREAITVASERDLREDVGFALRQLTDTAVRAMSPGVNDPTTAVTCVGYLRAILVRLAGRAVPAEVRRLCDGRLHAIVPRRGFEEELESFVQLGRYLGGDAWVGREILAALTAIAQAARDGELPERVDAARAVAERVAEQLLDEVATGADRDEVTAALGRVRAAAEPTAH